MTHYRKLLKGVAVSASRCLQAAALDTKLVAAGKMCLGQSGKYQEIMDLLLFSSSNLPWGIRLALINPDLSYFSLRELFDSFNAFIILPLTLLWNIPAL